MNLTSASQVKSLLAEHGLRPKKRLGQNFLVDRNVLDRLVAAADAGPGVSVLEIGPGLGVVTRELAERGARVVCVEADRELVPPLQAVLAGTNVETVVGDFLSLDLAEFLSERGEQQWTVVGNLPYYITSSIIGKLIDCKQMISSVLMMVQREVAGRLQAEAGSKEYGALTVFVQYHCVVESVMRVSRNVFYPVPEVDSEIVRLRVRQQPPAHVFDEALFFRVVRAAFGKRRKTLLNALGDSAELGWDKSTASAAIQSAQIDPGRRGETLAIDEFARLSNAAAFDTGGHR